MSLRRGAVRPPSLHDRLSPSQSIRTESENLVTVARDDRHRRFLSAIGRALGGDRSDKRELSPAIPYTEFRFSIPVTIAPRRNYSNIGSNVTLPTVRGCISPTLGSRPREENVSLLTT